MSGHSSFNPFGYIKPYIKGKFISLILCFVCLLSLFLSLLFPFRGDVISFSRQSFSHAGIFTCAEVMGGGGGGDRGLKDDCQMEQMGRLVGNY